MKNEKCSTTLGAAKNIYSTLFFQESTKHDTAEIIVFSLNYLKSNANGVHGINFL